MPSGFVSTSSSTIGASSASCCSGVNDTLPRPWYERVQSIAGTPSVSGGASSRPSVRERCERASVAADSAVALRFVGTGGSLAGKEGVTVRVGLEVVGRANEAVDVVGLVVVVVVDVVDVVAAALGLDSHAARGEDSAKLRLCIR
jgi:hypothetical protein